MPQHEAYVELASPLLDLLERGCAAAQSGQYADSVQLLTQVWADSPADDDLAIAAAWAIGWALLGAQDYGQAALWFARVDAPPAQVIPWAFVRQTLVEHCHELAAVSAPVAPLPLLSIRSLGALVIERGGQLLSLSPARKPIGILRFLLASPHQRATRDELAELFWPDSAPREAAHSLHVAIAALRRHLDPPGASYITFEAGCYALASDAPIFDDAHHFQCQLDEAERHRRAGNMPAMQAALAGAIACYNGDYYVDERDGAWAIVERERLLIGYLAALDRLGRVHIAQGHYEDAAECFRLLLDRDAYREDACANLIRCYQSLNRRPDALRAYQRCRETLRDDLGLEPGEELQVLIQFLA